MRPILLQGGPKHGEQLMMNWEWLPPYVTFPTMTWPANIYFIKETNTKLPEPACGEVRYKRKRNTNVYVFGEPANG